MSSNHRIENVLTQVRAQLNLEHVELWKPPYYIEPNTIDDKLEELGRDYALKLGIPSEMTIAAVKELQSNALEKLSARAKFNATGIASLKVRIPNQPGGTVLHSFETKLDENGSVLQELIAAKMGVTCNRVTIIASGHVIDPLRTLSSQNVTNNQQLLALIRSEDDSNDVYEITAKIKSDAEILIKNRHSDDYMVMEDQKGNRIYLPEAENKALMLGLAMHKKGRGFLNRENYNLALVLFLEADEQFRSVQSSLLQSVDNYALLNLDIVWCYLCLKSVSQLPDADRRLKLCDDNFRKSYGDNFDRVVGLKGSDGNEKALVMRLHLLQAILYYHQNRRNEAQVMLSLAETELVSLRVDEQALTTLVEMGYDTSEARIALRASQNNVEGAINDIMERREQRAEARKKAREDRKLLGREFRDGTVNPTLLKQLIDMNFDKDLASVALEKSGNEINEALNLLYDKSDELKQDLTKRRKTDVEQSLLNDLISLGFHKEIARLALLKHFNDLNASLDFLTKLKQDGRYDETLSGLHHIQPGPSTSNAPSTTQSNPLSKSLEKAKELLDQKISEEEAFNRFREGYNENDDDYLDLPLVQEEALILEYKQALYME